MEFDIGDDENVIYKIEVIWDSAIYTKESKSGYLLDLYYLISWKRYLKEENTWKLVSLV